MRWGPACRITNLLESNSWYQGLGGRHTPGRVGPDSHRRRLTGRLISKWDGLDHALAHPLLRCRGPLVRRSKTYEQLCIFTSRGSSVDVSIWAKPALGKANCAFPGPHSERRRTEGLSHLSLKVPRRKRDTRGSSPMTFHPKECGKHLRPPHKPLEWTGLALQWIDLAGTPALYRLGS